MSTSDKNAAIYARTSKEYRNQERVSIDQQVEDGLRLAAAQKLQLRAEHIYKDADWRSSIAPRHLANGAKKVRPELSRLFDAIERGEINTVICRKRDRLARPYDLTRDIMKFFAERNVALLFTHEASLADDASGRFAARMIMSVAEYELERLSENVRAAKRYQREHGLKMCYARSIGYKDGKHGEILIDTAVQPLVRQIFERTIEGESETAICRWLNDEHHDLAVGKIWHRVTIFRLLRDVRCIGQRRDGSGSDPLYKPLIEPDLFWEGQEVLKSRKGSKAGKKSRHILSGILRCGYCKHGLGFVKWDSCHAYDCVHRHLSHTHRPFAMQESEWLRFVPMFFRDECKIKRSGNPEASLLQAQLHAADESVDELAALFAKKKLSAEAFAVATQKIEANKEAIRKRIESMPRAAEFSVQEWSDCKTVDALRAFIQDYIQSIYVYGKLAEVRLHGERLALRFPLLKQRRKGSIKARNVLVPDAVNDLDDVLLRVDGKLCKYARGKTIAPVETIKPADRTVDWTEVLGKDVKLA